MMIVKNHPHRSNLEALLYIDETQIVNVNVNLVISALRLMNTAQNNSVQDIHYVLRFVKVKQHTLCLCFQSVTKVVNEMEMSSFSR